MIKVAVMTDLHGNLPALHAALGAIRRLGCDAIYHTGDAIAIGPHPAECLDLLLDTADAHMTMGNHDSWFAYGLPEPQPSWMSDGEVLHQQWGHAQLDPALRDVVAQWPDTIEETFSGVRVLFLHYETDAPILQRPRADELDGIFADRGADVVFYGHTHVAWEAHGRSRYVNPGSLGCDAEPVARFVVLTCTDRDCRVEKHAVPYDDGPLYEAFERRQVPERFFLYRAFYGSRFHVTAEDVR